MTDQDKTPEATEFPTSFVDAEGHRWSVRIGVEEVLRISEQCGIAVSKTRYDEVCGWFIDDLKHTTMALWAVCEPQAEKLGLSPTEFVHRLNGVRDGEPVLDAATSALIGAWSDFRHPAFGRYVRNLGQTLREKGRVALESLADASIGGDESSSLPDSAE